MEGQDYSSVAVVMVPFPAQGHLNQLLHLSHLVSSYGVQVHYTGASEHNRQAKLRLQGWHSGEEGGNRIQFHDFQLPPYDSPPPSTHFPAHMQPMWETCMHLRQPVSELLRQLSTEFRRVVVVHDMMMPYVVQDVEHIPNAESYNFIPLSAFNMFLSMYNAMNQKLPFEIDSDTLPKSNIIPNDDCCLTPEIVRLVAEKVEKYSGLENGSLCNTTRVIEGRYVELLEKLSSDGKKFFAIGPFNPVKVSKHESETQRNECLEWLDNQERGSVIYVSFGSMTSICDDQIREIAEGLERSGQKFIWVLRDADKSNVFTENDAVRRPQLPEGYEERVRNRGIVVREWAPQLEILAHSSTGGFLSHCGWNSCMESISSGVAIATWPMHSDQPRNAVLVTEVLKTGTVVRDWASRSELVSSTDVESAVRRLMASEEGEGIRKRAAELGDAVRKSASSGGTSRLEMDSFIAHITR